MQALHRSDTNSARESGRLSIPVCSILGALVLIAVAVFLALSPVDSSTSPPYEAETVPQHEADTAYSAGHTSGAFSYIHGHVSIQGASGVATQIVLSTAGSETAVVEPNGHGRFVSAPLKPGTPVTVVLTANGPDYALGEAVELSRTECVLPADGGYLHLPMLADGSSLASSYPPRLLIVDSWGWPVANATAKFRAAGGAIELSSSRLGFVALPPSVDSGSEVEVGSTLVASAALKSRTVAVRRTMIQEVVLQPKGLHRLTVKVPAPPEGACFISMQRSEGHPRVLKERILGNNECTFEQVPSGRYLVWGTSGRHLSARKLTTVGDSTRTVTAEPWRLAAVKVRVIGPAGPVVRVPLLLVERSERVSGIPRRIRLSPGFPRSGDWRQPRFAVFRVAEADRSGVAIFGAVPDGSYELTALDPRWQLSKCIEVTCGDVPGGVQDGGIVRASKSEASVSVRIDQVSESAKHLSVLLAGEFWVEEQPISDSEESVVFSSIGRGLYGVRLSGIMRGKKRWLSGWRGVDIGDRSGVELLFRLAD